MPHVLHYWMLDPLRGGVTDNGSSKPTFEAEIRDEVGRVADVNVFCDQAGDPLFIKVRLRDVPNEHDQDAFGPLLITIREHLMSVLRLTWHHDARLVPMQFWSVEGPNGEGANFQAEIPNSFPFDGPQAKNLFIHTLPSRQSFRLLMDGVDEGVPISYRFLSLFKFLEIRFLGANEEWDHTAVSEALGPFEDQYAALRLPRTFFKELCHLRDRCAHIRTGKGSRRVLGVTQLHYDALIGVEKVLPLLVDVCRAIFNKEHAGKLEISDLRPWYRKLFPQM